MDKVICDICGTSYPANADQCPICGYEKAADPIMDEELGLSDAAPAYKPVKGGRFSDANVRKRNKAASVPAVPYDYDQDEDDEDDYDEDDYDEDEMEEGKERSNKGLVAVLVLLIIAILGLILYLYFNFFVPVDKPDTDDQPASTTTAAATTEAPETEEPTVPCTSLEVSDTEITLDAVGNAWLLNVVATPADTTDSITYVSSDEAVATVSSEGCITAVGPGEAVITVTCGNVVVECKVHCAIETEPVTEATEAPTEPELNWGLNREEFTIRVGEKWPLYEGDVSTALITFKARDTSVVTISKSGIVTGVGDGWTMVTAEYNGVVKECKVFCRQPKTETTPPETTPPETGSGEAG